jgi:hypothetical protein
MSTPIDSSRSALPPPAAAIGDGAIAVLGHAHAGAGHHEGRNGGDIEGARAVAAGAAGIEQGLTREAVFHRHGHFAHGARESHQFLHRLALHPHGHHEGRQLRLAGLAAEDHAHGLARLFGRQAAPFGNRFQVGQKRHDIVRSSVQIQANTGSFSNENSRVSG